MSLRDRVCSRGLALGLTWSRMLLAPVLVMMAQRHVAPRAMAVCLLWGFISDYFDGVVARCAKADTPSLRLLDSVVDTVFYLGVAAAAWITYTDALRLVRWPIVIIIACEAANYAFAVQKLGKGASYHAYSAKAMGVALFAALFTLFWWQSAALLPGALLVALVAQAEVAIITSILPVWTHDVRSVWHARRVRSARGLTPPR